MVAPCSTWSETSLDCQIGDQNHFGQAGEGVLALNTASTSQLLNERK
jgi:hypothetical protein